MVVGHRSKHVVSTLDDRFRYRVTDGQTMKIVRMVLTGEVNQEIVSRISQKAGRLSECQGLMRSC